MMNSFLSVSLPSFCKENVSHLKCFPSSDVPPPSNDQLILLDSIVFSEKNKVFVKIR